MWEYVLVARDRPRPYVLPPHSQLGQGRGRHIGSWELLLEEPQRRLRMGVSRLRLPTPPLLHNTWFLAAAVSQPCSLPDPQCPH